MSGTLLVRTEEKERFKSREQHTLSRIEEDAIELLEFHMANYSSLFIAIASLSILPYSAGKQLKLIEPRSSTTMPAKRQILISTINKSLNMIIRVIIHSLYRVIESATIS